MDQNGNNAAPPSAITYRYALTDRGGLIDIAAVVRRPDSSRRRFRCLACRRDLVPKLGAVRTHHFAHKSVGVCSWETYLHQLGKLSFHAEYNRCLRENLPFLLELPRSVVCDRYERELGLLCREEETTCHDLTRFFDRVDMERRMPGIVPDLLLSGREHGELLLVEITVSNPVDEIKKLCGHRIVEIQLRTEDDLDAIREHCVRASASNIRLFNFRVPPRLARTCRGPECGNTYGWFIVYRSGKAIRIEETPADFAALLRDREHAIIHHRRLPARTDAAAATWDFFDAVTEAHLGGIRVRNCCLCSHGSPGRRGVLCALTKREQSSSTASACPGFRIARQLRRHRT